MTFTRTAAPLLGLATLAALGLAAKPAAAQTTISFDNYPVPTDSYTILGSSYNQDGFTFTSTDSNLVVASGSSGYGDGETSLFDDQTNGTVTLTQSNGLPFSLNSLDIGSQANNALPGYLAANTLLTGTLLTGGTVTDTVTYSGAAKTFKFFNLVGLTSLTLTGQSTSSSGYGSSVPAFDNLVLNAPAAVPAAAPEPSAVAGLGVTALGLGGLLLRARRRRA